jgi:hypothetical protein
MSSSRDKLIELSINLHVEEAHQNGQQQQNKKKQKSRLLLEILFVIHTYALSSLVMLLPVNALFGAVKLLLGFTFTSSKSMPKVYATA